MMWTDAFWGILIPFAGTALGSACVFFLKKELGRPVQRALTGFAGGVIGALLTEIVLTCIFVYVILNVTDEKAGTSKKAGIIIGLTLTLVHLIGIPLTGTSVNPARSIATAFSALIYNANATPLAQVWMFILAPLAGAACAAYLYKFLHTEKE